MVIITRGGVVPGGLLGEALDIQDVLTAAVDFPFEMQREETRLLAWPQFIQFPDGRTNSGDGGCWWWMTSGDRGGRSRLSRTGSRRPGGLPSTCVLHFNPHRSLFNQAQPDYYAAITDAHIVYPWEIDRGPGSGLEGPTRVGREQAGSACRRSPDRRGHRLTSRRAQRIIILRSQAFLLDR